MLVAVVFTFALASMAQAQATRTWVSGVGDDVNPCSRTAPCKTFAGAISKTATGGEIDCIDPGGFGAVTITKSITIDGGGTFASILSSGTTGITINAPVGSVVVIRNLSINGAGTGLNGIRMIAGGTLSVENVVISNVTTHGIHVNLANGALGFLYVKDTIIRTGATAASSSGIRIEPVSGVAGVVAVIDNTRLEKMPVGLFTGNGAIVSIRNSVVYSTTTGIVTQAAGNAQTNIENCVINHNGTGVQAGTGAGTITRLSNSMVINNSLKGLAAAGGSLVSFGNNSVFGNAADDAPTTTTPQI
jgi:hypothetical protein